MVLEQVLADWHAFVREGLAGANVPAEILESWERCSRAGVDPLGVAAPLVDEAQLATRILASHQLVSGARAHVDFMAAAMRERRFLVAVLDADGWCVDIRGDSAMTAALRDASLCLGSSWSERVAGTNGPGTALVSGRAVMVRGAEHFRQCLHNCATVGVPVYRPDSSSAGALAFVGEAAGFDPAWLDLVTSSARIIEREWRVSNQENRLRALRRSLVDSGLLQAVVVDTQGNIVDTSRTTQVVLGDLRGYNDIVSQIRSGKNLVTTQALRSGRRVYRRYQMDDELEYDVMSVPLVGSDASPLGAVTLAVDRSEEARLSRNLAEKTALLEAFTRVDDLLLYILDGDLNILYASGMSLRMAGESAQSLFGRSFLGICVPETRERVKESLTGRKTQVVDQWLTINDGSKRQLHFVTVPVWQDDRFVGDVILGVDTTATHEAVERASKAESIVEALFESNDQMACITDAQGAILRVSSCIKDKYGVSPEETLGKNAAQFHEASPVMQVLSSGKPSFGIIRSPMLGSLKAWVLPIRDAAGNMLGTLVVAHDATEEDAIQALKAGLFQNTVIGVMVVDPGGIIREANGCSAAMLRMAQQDALGRSVDQLFSSRTAASIHECLQTASTPAHEVEHLQLDEEEVWLDLGVTPVGSGFDGPEAGGVLIIRDVTEQVRLEQKARRAEQLQMVGELASRAAHEFRNPLGAIKAAADLGLVVVEHPRASELFKKIHHYVETLNEFVDDFLYLGRPRSSELRPELVSPIMGRAFETVEHLAGESGVRIELRCDDADLTVMAESKALCRALVNLLRNSIQAMPGGGYVEMVSRAVGEDMAEIVIHDTGPGIVKEAIAHLFEPFFTTRDDGNGLGLPIVHQIIAEMHHGCLEVMSERGEGTAVFVRIHRVRPPKKPA